MDCEVPAEESKGERRGAASGQVRNRRCREGGGAAGVEFKAAVTRIETPWLCKRLGLYGLGWTESMGSRLMESGIGLAAMSAQ